MSLDVVKAAERVSKSEVADNVEGGPVEPQREVQRPLATVLMEPRDEQVNTAFD